VPHYAVPLPPYPGGVPRAGGHGMALSIGYRLEKQHEVFTAPRPPFAHPSRAETKEYPAVPKPHSAIRPETATALASYYLRMATEGEGMSPQAEHKAIVELIDRCCPHGSIEWARLEGPNQAMIKFGVTTKLAERSSGKEDGERIIRQPRAIPLIMTLSLFGGHPHINATPSSDDRAQGQRDLDYVYMFSGKIGGEREPRLTLGRILANAVPGQAARLPIHRDLSELPKVPSGRAKSWARAEATATALKRHAHAKGRRLGLSADDYAALIRHAFDHFDGADAQEREPIAAE
jgi:hypothetical protein